MFLHAAVQQRSAVAPVTLLFGQGSCCRSLHERTDNARAVGCRALETSSGVVMQTMYCSIAPIVLFLRVVPVQVLYDRCHGAIGIGSESIHHNTFHGVQFG